MPLPNRGSTEKTVNSLLWDAVKKDSTVSTTMMMTMTMMIFHSRRPFSTVCYSTVCLSVIYEPGTVSKYVSRRDLRSILAKTKPQLIKPLVYINLCDAHIYSISLNAVSFRFILLQQHVLRTDCTRTTVASNFVKCHILEIYTTVEKHVLTVLILSLREIMLARLSSKMRTFDETPILQNSSQYCKC